MEDPQAQSERAVCAYHEASHCVIAIILGQRIEKATLCEVVPCGGAAPWVTAIVAFSGPCGEEKYRPPRDWGDARPWGGDMIKAIKALPDLVDRRAAMEAAEALVEKHWSQIELVARELLARGSLNADEIDGLL